MKSLHDQFWQHQAQTTSSPIGLEVERAEGLYIYGTNGKQYMDMISGVAVSNIGHRHPKVLEAIRKQLDSHLHVMVYGEYLQTTQAQLAEKLTCNLPDPLDCVYFVNSGAEAIEGAMKLVRRVTGRSKILAAHRSYHGNTMGALSISGNETKKSAFRPLIPDVGFIHFNHLEDLQKIDATTAGVVLETVQGDAGVRLPSAEYLKAVKAQCERVGALLVLDEIQTGFGRTGSLFAFQQFGVVPDVVAMAKGMGGGMPIGAFAAAKPHMEQLTHQPMLGHITTFGGHPVNCAAGLANLEVLLKEDWIAQASEKGNRIAAHLNQHPKVKEVRHLGLMFAVELENFDEVYRLFQYCLEHGVIGFWFLSSNNSFRLAPPLCITTEEIDAACAVIQAGLDTL
ncbi:MAG: aspartate aminotransferase family protein [Salibacteraceae bacterium]